MNVRKIIIYVVTVSLLFGTLSGCGGEDEEPQQQAEPNTESNIPPSTDVSPLIEPDDSPEQASAADPEVLKRQIEEVRKTFLSLQEICRANDIEGYLDSWDYETKMLDGRDLSLDERRERMRKSLTKRPSTLRDIANAVIKSITVDTSQAEKIKVVMGIEIKGTMLLVRTAGLAYLFHETDKGWKLFTMAPPEYFR
jgi:hypothetical protein